MQAPLTFAVDNRLPDILERVQQMSPRRRARTLAPLEQLLYAVVAEGLSASAALASYRHLRGRYPRLTDLRDADPAVIEAALVGVPAAHLKAAALPRIMVLVEQEFGALSLDGLGSCDNVEALRFLTRLPRVTDEIAASVLSFAGAERAVLTIDRDTARPVRRLGLSEPGAPLSALPRQVIERAPISWRGDQFAELSAGLGRIAARFCHHGKPDCHACPLAALCPSAEALHGQADIVAFPFGRTRSARRRNGLEAHGAEGTCAS